MKVLVTGGQGYIGNYLTKALLEKGHFVTTLDSGFASKPFDFGDNKNLRRFAATICNPDTVVRAMEGADIVYHLAARMEKSTSFRHAIRLVNVNVEGTTAVLAMAKKIGVQKFVFMSSAAVYGNLINASETDPTCPIDMYGCTKLAAEAIVRGFYQDGMDTVILRLFNAWGRQGSKSVISHFLKPEAKINGDGEQTRDFVFIDDIVEALVNAGVWESGIYNIGSGEEVQINALWKLLRDDSLTYSVNGYYQEIENSCADPSFTLNTTGWKAKTLLSQLSREEIKKFCES